MGFLSTLFKIKMKKYLIAMALMLFALANQAQTKKFNWISWHKVSPEVKSKLKAIKINKTETLYSSIAEAVTDAKAMGGTYNVMVAEIDLDGDGLMGYAVGYSGSYFCGSSGCPIEVYEKNGTKTLSVTDMWSDVKPAKNGIITSQGRFVALKTSK
ncbi:hypothetical protein MASR2M52_02710 [Pedobacter sp.]